MGYAIGTRDGRDIGYGVPCECDQPECRAKIDRGLSYLCKGCGLFFCNNHTTYGKDCEPVCNQCFHGWDPYPKKPDTKEWLNHKLMHSSWRKWRKENPEEVHKIQKTLEKSE